MSKSSPPKDLQDYWYKKLKDEGFEDIEDHNKGGHEVLSNGQRVDAEDGGCALKSWTRTNVKKYYNSIDGFYTDGPFDELQTIFPQSQMLFEEALFNHKDLLVICKDICRHGNHQLRPKQIKLVLELYIEGKTIRGIAEKLNVDHVLIFRTIQTLKQWAALIGHDDE